MIDVKRIIEALLFASAEPLSTKALHERMETAGHSGADVGAALMALKADYAGRGVTLVELDGQWAFRTAADLGNVLAQEKQVEKKLSRAALETLAIIAYHQPVTRAEIENIRGVSTHRGMLDVLIEAGWVKPGRRRESPGRPLTWVTSSGFLDQFSLESIMDLPGLDDLKASGLLDRRPAIEAIPGVANDDDDLAGDLFAGQDAREGVEPDTEEKIIL
ncbi:MAG: SMC-Scp complex subunit ScpB [Bdellovibrionales bacterium]